MPDTSNGRKLPLSAELVHALMRHTQDRGGLAFADQVVRHSERLFRRRDRMARLTRRVIRLVRNHSSLPK